MLRVQGVSLRVYGLGVHGVGCSVYVLGVEVMKARGLHNHAHVYCEYVEIFMVVQGYLASSDTGLR